MHRDRACGRQRQHYELKREGRRVRGRWKTSLFVFCIDAFILRTIERMSCSVIFRKQWIWGRSTIIIQIGEYFEQKCVIHVLRVCLIFLNLWLVEG